MPARSYSHSYGPHPEQHADLCLPEHDDGERRFPVVVLLHGGFWRERFTKELMEPHALDLAARGFAAYNVEYRRLDADGGWPETVDDVEAAIDALDDLAGEHPLDLDRVSVVGHSAGGHLALMVARKAHAVVAAAPVADVAEAIRADLGAGVVARFANDTEFEACSPICRLPTGTPTLLVHGTDDDTVPPEQSKAYADAAGGEAELRLRDGEGHYEFCDPETDVWREVVAWIESRP